MILASRNRKRMDPQLQHIHRYFWASYDIDGDSTENSVVTISPEGNSVTAMWKDVRGCMVRKDTRSLLEAITAEKDNDLYEAAINAMSSVQKGDTVSIIRYRDSDDIRYDEFRKGKVPKGWADGYASEYLDIGLWEETK